MNNIGFMQGRLVDRIDGKIQAFPWDTWQLEFPRAQALGLTAMEWTLDDERLEQNPFITEQGQAEIRALMARHGVAVHSLTGDCFMQMPFWKYEGQQRSELLRKFDLVLAAAARLEVRFVVVPLVDNGRLETSEQRDVLVRHLLERAEVLRATGVQVIFETDYGPDDYRAFMALLPADVFNVNYDIGNSASLGFDPDEEFAAYGERIVNVHVKDRKLGGTTVPLGTGDADFEKVMAGLARRHYAGSFILQTARADDGDHAGALARYVQMVTGLLSRHYGT
ncbi:hypothetical protein HFRIS_000820 [Herbaspirillum frisingense GSF30]|uniref:Xylose isomerase-like TIM barrel domain-containing protein n=2 Tax=Herbaspirillum frisingense TaxID=92645 RepID=A0AAI9IIL4_9BURK|nr:MULTISPECIES: sugar phosphate isomerase/epimerase family protein [Herbaspirillum]EOA06811.1 hypothetical protein HFRIS_000820 [Herbaspirillum frisingense GSF30]ONN67016.1 xylose isomerase [Herbaspirillum sp. VT-16-41]